MEIIVEETNANHLNAGFNFNNIDKASLLVNLTFRNRMPFGTRLSIDAILSANTTINSSIQFINDNVPEINVDLRYKKLTSNIYEHSDKVSTVDINYYNADVSTFKIFWNNYLIGAGAQIELQNLIHYSPKVSEK